MPAATQGLLDDAAVDIEAWIASEVDIAFAEQEAAAFISGQGFNPWIVIIAILILYLLLGCVMDSLSMILLTIPIFFPIVSVLDYGLGAEEFAIWFGILVLIVVEVGLITPPVCTVLNVVCGVAKISMESATRGVWPFLLAYTLLLGLFTVFPGIITMPMTWFR